MALYPCHRSAHTRHPRAHCAEFHRRRLTLPMKINHRQESTISHSNAKKSKSYKYVFFIWMLEARVYFSLNVRLINVLIILKVFAFLKCQRINNSNYKQLRTNLPKSLCVILVARVIFFTFFLSTQYLFLQSTNLLVLSLRKCYYLCCLEHKWSVQDADINCVTDLWGTSFASIRERVQFSRSLSLE